MAVVILTLECYSLYWAVNSVSTRPLAVKAVGEHCGGLAAFAEVVFAYALGGAVAWRRKHESAEGELEYGG